VSKHAARISCSARRRQPEEIPAAVLFLAIDASDYMLGSELIVDGESPNFEGNDCRYSASGRFP
jgi:hypothetical protein